MDEAEYRLPGTVGVVCERLARYTDFTISLTNLWMPLGSRVSWAMSSSIPENHEMLMRQFEGEWLWILGDDHTFEPDVLFRLLGHEVDVVVPLVTRRSPPITPVAYQEVEGERGYAPVDLTGEEGLVRVAAAGSAGMLIRRGVFERLGDPPYCAERLLYDPDQPEHRRVGVDISFCENLREHGIDVWLDPGARLGHIGQVTYSMDLRGGEWGVVLDCGNDSEIFLTARGADDEG